MAGSTDHLLDLDEGPIVDALASTVLGMTGPKVVGTIDRSGRKRIDAPTGNFADDLVDAPHLGLWDARFHPRDRTGRFRESVAALKKGGEEKLPGGIRVVRTGRREYTVQGGVDRGERKFTSATIASQDALERASVREKKERVFTADRLIRLRNSKEGDVVRVGSIRVVNTPGKEGYTVSGDELPAEQFKSDTAAVLAAKRRARQKGDTLLAGEKIKPTSIDKVVGNKKVTRRRDLKNTLGAQGPIASRQWTEDMDTYVPYSGQGDAPSDFISSFMNAASGGRLEGGEEKLTKTAEEILNQAAPHVASGVSSVGNVAADAASHLASVAPGAVANAPQIITALTHLMSLLTARHDRLEAEDGTAWTRARARERVLREAWEAHPEDVRAEALHLMEVGWTPSLHPRNREGQWVDVLGKLSVQRERTAQAITDSARKARVQREQAKTSADNWGRADRYGRRNSYATNPNRVREPRTDPTNVPKEQARRAKDPLLYPVDPQGGERIVGDFGTFLKWAVDDKQGPSRSRNNLATNGPSSLPANKWVDLGNGTEIRRKPSKKRRTDGVGDPNAWKGGDSFEIRQGNVVSGTDLGGAYNALATRRNFANVASGKRRNLVTTPNGAREWMKGAAWSGFMYHGTGLTNAKSIGEGVNTPVFFTTDTPGAAREWGSSHTDNPVALPVAVRFNKPLILSLESYEPKGLTVGDFEIGTKIDGKGPYERAREAGYDGVVGPTDTLREGETWAIALDPKAVRVVR